MALTATAEQSNSKRSLIIGVVIAIHVAGVYVMESGLSKKITEYISPPVETKIIEEEKPPEEPPPPPPPPPEMPTTPPPFIPPPEVAVQVQVQNNPIQTVTTEIPPVTPPVTAPPAPPAATATPDTKPGYDPKNRPRPVADYYPAASVRAEEEGVTKVSAYVAENGKITEVVVKESSGFPKLDEAALKYVKTFRMVAATKNGAPVGAWVEIPVRWKLDRK